MTISKERVKPSPIPDSWKLSEIFATGIVLGSYLALMTVIFFLVAYETNFFPNRFGVGHFRNSPDDPVTDEVKVMLGSAVYLQTAFANKNDFGREAREAAWATEQRTLHGLQPVESKMFAEKHTFRDINALAGEARRRAEIARLRELHALKGRVESFAKLRGLYIDAMSEHYTV